MQHKLTSGVNMLPFCVFFIFESVTVTPFYFRLFISYMCWNTNCDVIFVSSQSILCAVFDRSSLLIALSICYVSTVYYDNITANWCAFSI